MAQLFYDNDDTKAIAIPQVFLANSHAKNAGLSLPTILLEDICFSVIHSWNIIVKGFLAKLYQLFV